MKSLNINIKTITTLGFFIFSATFTSCAKKGAPVRAVKQTEAKPMNAATSSQSQTAAGAQNLLYDVTSIAFPILNDTEITMNSEMKTPDGRYIPITTIHKNNVDSVGVIDDMQINGNKIDIRARCVDNNNNYSENCEKYLFLATVVKGGYAVHQLAVVSYSVDCKFNLENLNPKVSGLKLYSSLDDLAKRNTAVPQNDCVGE